MTFTQKKTSGLMDGIFALYIVLKLSARSKFFTSNSLLVKIKEDHYNLLRALNILQPALLIFQLNQDNQRTTLTSLDVVFLFQKISGHIRMIRLDFEVVRAVVALPPTSSFSSLAGRKFDSVYYIEAGW